MTFARGVGSDVGRTVWSHVVLPLRVAQTLQGSFYLPKYLSGTCLHLPGFRVTPLGVTWVSYVLTLG